MPIASKTTTLDLLGGLGYTRESYYDGTTNNLLTATLGDEFAHKTYCEHFDNPEPVLPAVAQPDQQLPRELQLWMATKLNGWLTANMNFHDQYVSEPVPGNKNNDIIFTTGLGFTFGGKKYDQSTLLNRARTLRSRPIYFCEELQADQFPLYGMAPKSVFLKNHFPQHKLLGRFVFVSKEAATEIGRS